MKPEAKAWQDLKKILDTVPGFEYERVENSVSRSTPDINFSFMGKHGWIELKALEYPTKLSNKFSIPHLTETQRAWLTNRGAIAGCCWLLVLTPAKGKIPAYIIAIAHDQLDLVGGATWDEVLVKARGVWAGKISPESLARRLIC